MLNFKEIYEDGRIPYNYTTEEIKFWIYEFESAKEFWEKSNKTKAKYEFYIGVTREDVQNGNYEAEYLWFLECITIDYIKQGLMFLVKDGYTSGSPYDRVGGTSRTGVPGNKIVWAVFYHPKRNSETDFDKIYHPKMVEDGFLMPFAEPVAFGGGTEWNAMMTPWFKVEYKKRFSWYRFFSWSGNVLSGQ